MMKGDNPNGSIDDIAAICNPKGNIMGMMPHPERASDNRFGSKWFFNKCDIYF